MGRSMWAKLRLFHGASALTIAIVGCGAFVAATLVLHIVAKPRASHLAFPEGNAKDFGTVDEGKQVIWNVKIQNNGNEKLEIRNIQPSCGCTHAEIDAADVAPGMATELHVFYNSRPNIERDTIQVLFRTNDPTNKSAVVQLKGYVRPKALASPPGLNFIGQSGRSLPEKAVTVWTEIGGSLTLVSSSTSSSRITARWEDSGGKYQCLVGVSTDCPAGQWNENVHLDLNTPNGPKAIDVPVSVIIQGASLQ